MCLLAEPMELATVVEVVAVMLSVVIEGQIPLEVTISLIEARLSAA